MTKKKVTLAWPYLGDDGVNHKPDTTLELDRAEANRLLAAGLARVADDTKSAKTDTSKKG